MLKKKPATPPATETTEQTGSTTTNTKALEEEKAPELLADSVAQEEKEAPKKPKKIYLGKKYKKGYTKSGKGNSRIIEQFGYQRKFTPPKDYVLDIYYYDVKKRKIFRARELPETSLKILHGPYKKLVGGKVVEEGFFNNGSRHGRWERYNKDNILQAKDYFNNGYPRDAVIFYYDGSRTKIKQVIPFEYGEKTGQYVEFYENGEVHWRGWYENGQRVGVWTEYFDFKNRKHYEYQYPETAEEPAAEPVLLKEYDRNGKMVYELKKPGPKKPMPVRRK